MRRGLVAEVGAEGVSGGTDLGSVDRMGGMFGKLAVSVAGLSYSAPVLRESCRTPFRSAGQPKQNALKSRTGADFLISGHEDNRHQSNQKYTVCSSATEVECAELGEDRH